MPDTINISSIEGLTRHYSEKHPGDISVEKAYIKDNTVIVVIDGDAIQIMGCTLCGKKIVLDNREVRITKILEHMKNIVLRDAEHQNTNLIGMIHELSTNIKKTNRITHTQLQQLVRTALYIMVEKNDE